MHAFLVAGPIGILFYNLFPAAGPDNLFGAPFRFAPVPPGSLTHVLLEPVRVLVPRNAMPLLHLAWTLLAWCYSRNLAHGERVVAFLFLSLAAFPTLGTAEHWLADLVLAFPFALMIRALCAYQLRVKDARRHLAFGFGLFATLNWLLLLRYGARLFWTSPVIPWSLVAGTLALTTMRQRILADAQQESAEAEKARAKAVPAATPRSIGVREQGSVLSDEPVSPLA